MSFVSFVMIAFFLLLLVFGLLLFSFSLENEVEVDYVEQLYNGGTEPASYFY